MHKSDYQMDQVFPKNERSFSLENNFFHIVDKKPPSNMYQCVTGHPLTERFNSSRKKLYLV